MLSIYGISCDSASCLRNDRMCGKRVSFMFTRSVFTLCYWKCLSYKDCVKGLHDNVLFTFSKNTQDRADFTNIRKNTDYCSSPTVTFPSVGAPGTFSPGSPLHLSSCERGVTCLHLSVLACQQRSARLHSWTSNYCIDLDLPTTCFHDFI